MAAERKQMDEREIGLKGMTDDPDSVGRRQALMLKLRVSYVGAFSHKSGWAWFQMRCTRSGQLES